MGRIDTHLDACRLSSEILQRLRKVIREVLRAEFAEAWERDGIPAELHGHLSQRQAREMSINWNLSDSSDLLDYAGFANLYEIINGSPSLLQRFLPLAPDANVLRIRFLELDTILNRIAYARAVSDADLGFLASFDERFKKGASAAPGGEAASVRPPRSAPPAKPESASAPRGGNPSPAKTAPPATTAPAAAPPTPAPAAPPTPAPVSEVANPAPEPAAPPAAEPAANDTPSAVAAKPARSATTTPVALPSVDAHELAEALRRGEPKLVLTALYHEVTALADGLWNGSPSSSPLSSWERVRESNWYHENFVRLGLKPVSDFFGLYETAQDKLRGGSSHGDLQEYLKEHNFVQVLLALKELFRQHLRP
ncbi:MAG TPA: hypothetical protein VLW17_03120 [Thermoanaerobaculaceae bacterium]|nr:hypothetical protein [Thermoanaerobaculaceae bacterium]